MSKKIKILITLILLTSSLSLIGQNKKQLFIKEKSDELTAYLYDAPFYKVNEDDKHIIDEISTSTVKEMIMAIEKKGDEKSLAYHRWMTSIMQNFIDEVALSVTYMPEYEDANTSQQSKVLTVYITKIKTKIEQEIFENKSDWVKKKKK